MLYGKQLLLHIVKHFNLKLGHLLIKIIINQVLGMFHSQQRIFGPDPTFIL